MNIRRSLCLAAGVLVLCPCTALAGHGKPPAKPGPAKSKGAYAETHYGFTCTWSKGGGGSASCSREDGSGLAVLVSRKVAEVAGADGTVLFSRSQPRHARGPGRPPSAGATFTHSQGGLVCEWSTANGGAVLCGGTDRRGYAVGVWSTVAVVIDASSKVVYIGKQP